MAAVLMLATGVTFGQNKEKQKGQNKEQKEKDTKLDEYDEIVIRRKDDGKDQKLVVEILDDQVIINGKPIDEFVNEEVIVRLRSPKRYMLEGPHSQFRERQFRWNDMQRDWNDMQRDMPGDRPFLGVSTEGSSEGARITNVSENSAAAKAGLKEGDVITRINDKEVFDHEQVSEVIGKLKPGDNVSITYKRSYKNDGKELSKESKTTATLGERKSMPPMPPVPPMPPDAPEGRTPPMIFNFDDGELREMFNFRHQGKPRLGIKAQDTEDGKGVKVLDVDDDSPAAKAGIKENDIIISFEGKNVNSARELAEASREAKDKSNLRVQLKRNGKTQNLEIQVPRKLNTTEL